MPDAQIHPTGTVSTPADYVVPGGAELRLKGVFAAFDGSAAAGSYQPLVRIVSDAGSTVIEAVSDTTIAAGASADASWFPHLAAAAPSAAASTGVEWFYATRVTAQSVPSANLNRISWTKFVTSDSTVFSVTTGARPNDTVHGLKAGAYVAVGQLNWAAPQTYQHYCQIVTDFFGFSPLVQSPVSDSATNATEATRQRLVGDMQVCLTQAVPGEISFLAGNADAVAHNVTLATYVILYFPNSILAT